MASNDDNNNADKDSEEAGGEQGDSSLYDDVVQNSDVVASLGGHFLDEKSIPKAQAQKSNRLPPIVTAETQHDSDEISLEEIDLSKPLMVNVKQDTLS